MDKLILVLYLNVGNLEGLEMENLIQSVGKKMFPDEVRKQLNAITFIIPIRDSESRLECINPNYVVDDELYAAHQKKLVELNNHLEETITRKKDGK